MPVNKSENENKTRKLVVEKPNAITTKKRKSPAPNVSFKGFFNFHLEYRVSTIMIIAKTKRFKPILAKYWLLLTKWIKCKYDMINPQVK
jgi:hypothetical protein